MKKENISFLSLLSTLTISTSLYAETPSEVNLASIEREHLNTILTTYSEKEKTNQHFSTVVFNSIVSYEPSFMRTPEKFANFIRRNHSRNGKGLLEAAMIGLTFSAIETYTPLNIRKIRDQVNSYIYYQLGNHGSHIKLSTSMPLIPHRCNGPSLHEERYLQNIECNTFRIQNKLTLDRPDTLIAIRLQLRF